MLAPSSRPLSPHLTIWRWGPHMLVSILHRITGAGLAIVGGLALLWWLWAAADGRESYDYFVSWATHWTGVVVGIGLSSTTSGVRRGGERRPKTMSALGHRSQGRPNRLFH